MMKRFLWPLTFVIILGAIITAVASPASAQMGACPPNAVMINPPLHGWYPPNLSICAAGAGRVVPYSSNDRYPCEQYLHVFDSFYELPVVNRMVWIVPPAYLEYGLNSRVKFLLWFVNDQQVITPPEPRSRDWMIQYFNSDGQRVRSLTGNTTDFNSVVGYYEDAFGIRHYYRVFIVDITVPTNSLDVIYGSGGYYTFMFTDEEERAYSLASIHVSSQNDYVPHCPVPNAQLPLPTATFSAGTPTPIAPTVTPTALYATQTPAGTIPATRTPTPIAFRTLLPEPYATPMSVPTLANIVWPTVSLPTLSAAVPIVTVEAAVTQQASYEEMEEQVVAVVTRWASNLEPAWASFEVTGTEGISSTAESLNVALSYAGYPIRFARSIAMYSPNTAPFWIVVMGAVGVILLTHITKFAIAIIATVLNFIKTLWEAIPFN